MCSTLHLFFSLFEGLFVVAPGPEGVLQLGCPLPLGLRLEPGQHVVVPQRAEPLGGRRHCARQLRLLRLLALLGKHKRHQEHNSTIVMNKQHSTNNCYLLKQ